MAVCLIGRLSVAKVCGIVYDGESWPVVSGSRHGGGWVNLSRKVGVGWPGVVVVGRSLAGHYCPEP